jgi:hypothetical protein
MDLRRLEAGKMEKDLKRDIVKGRLEGNTRIWCDNIKMCHKETSFDPTLNLASVTLRLKRGF